MGIADHAVEGESEDFRGATGGGGEGEMVGSVVEEFGIEHGYVGDGLAVGGPGGRDVETGVCGDLCEMSAFVGVGGGDGPDVGVVGGVGIGSGVVAGESE